MHDFYLPVQITYLTFKSTFMRAKLFALLFAISAISFSQAQETGNLVTYPVLIKFQSQCCGVPDDAPLRAFIRNFKKQNKIRKITAVKIGPMGKEGEYWLAFSLKGMTKKQKLSFIKKVQPVTLKMVDTGIATCETGVKVTPADLPSRATMETVQF